MILPSLFLIFTVVQGAVIPGNLRTHSDIPDQPNQPSYQDDLASGSSDTTGPIGAFHHYNDKFVMALDRLEAARINAESKPAEPVLSAEEQNAADRAVVRQCSKEVIGILYGAAKTKIETAGTENKAWQFCQKMFGMVRKPSGAAVSDVPDDIESASDDSYSD